MPPWITLPVPIGPSATNPKRTNQPRSISLKTSKKKAKKRPLRPTAPNCERKIASLKSPLTLKNKPINKSLIPQDKSIK
jgi:hypothetical protein